MTKQEELEKAVLMLEEQVATNKTMSETYLNDLSLAKKQLAEVNKPVLTPEQLDQVSDAVESAVSNFDFNGEGSYDKEFEIDYDGRVQLSNLEFQDERELIEAVVEQVQALFVEANMIGTEIDTTRNPHD